MHAVVVICINYSILYLDKELSIVIFTMYYFL